MAGRYRIHISFFRYPLETWGHGHNSQFGNMVRAAQSSRVALDVGAHVGFVSLPISRHQMPGGQTHAFEPAVANMRFLNLHVGQNQSRVQRIEIHPMVVAESSGLRSFQEEKIPSALNSCVFSGNQACSKRPAITLDDFCEQRRLIPDLLKIDTEGAEWECLAGAGQILKHRPRVFLSIHARGLERRAEIEEILARNRFHQEGAESIEIRKKGEYFFHAG